MLVQRGKAADRSEQDCRARTCAFFSGMLVALLTSAAPALLAEDPTAPALPKEPAPVTVPPQPGAQTERPKVRRWLDEPSEPSARPAAARSGDVIAGETAADVLAPDEEIVIEEDAAVRDERRKILDEEIKCKLLEAKLAYKKGDYERVMSLSKAIMAVDPRNITAAEWYRKAAGKLLDADELVTDVAGTRRDRERLLEVSENAVAPPPKMKALRPHFERREEMPDLKRREKIAQKLEERITVTFNKADLDFVLYHLFVLTGINFIADDAAIEEKTVTLRVLDLPVREVLNYIVRNNEGIQYSITEDAVWITATESEELKNIMYPRIYPLHHGLVSTVESSGASTGQRSGGTGRAGGGGRGGGGGGPGGGAAGAGTQLSLEPSYIETVLKWMKEGKDQQVFPDGSDYLVDRQSNQLIVYTTPAGHEWTNRFLNAFDQPAIQVLIKTRFLDISGLNEKELGVNIDRIKTRIGDFDGETGTDTSDPDAAAATPSRNPFRRFDFTGGTGPINIPGSLGAGNILQLVGRRTDPQFRITLAALLNNRQTKILSEPQVLAINNKQAIIDITQHFSYITDLRPVTTTTAVGNGVAVGNVPSFVPEFDEENIGFTLQVTPSVGRDLKTINLHLNPVIDELAEGQSIQQFQQFDASIAASTTTGQQASIRRPSINQTSLETDVVVEDNGYVIIGGLMRNFKETRERKVPGLHRIPFLGHLFKTTSTNLERRNLMIIVEAQIVTPAGRTYYKDPEPDDVGPREGGSYRSPGQVSELNRPRPNSVESALGVNSRTTPAAPRAPIDDNERENETPRRPRPVPLVRTPGEVVAAVEEQNPAPAPKTEALTARERMERLARATRANPVSLNSTTEIWAVPQEESVDAPAESSRGEVIRLPE